MAFEPQLRREFSPESIVQSRSGFMAEVYRWMGGGLLLTAGIATWVYNSPALFETLAPFFRFIALGQLALVIGFSFLASRVSRPIAAGMFLLYAATNGVLFSTIFAVYQLGSVAGVFAVSASAFLALSVYGTVTKRDFSAWRTFLFIGLFGVLIAGVVNIFLQSSMLDFVKSCAAVVVFAGLTAYDTQKLRALEASADASTGSLAIQGALTLYLDFINLFLSLLRLFGRRR